MDQKGLKAKLFMERSAGNTRAANRAKGMIKRGNGKGKLGGYFGKMKQGKWEERKPRDRNMTPFPERQFHLSISGETL